MENDRLRNLAVTFFYDFARFECALKAAGYYSLSQAYGDEISAANWEKFANEVSEEFDQLLATDGALFESVEYLINEPPRMQIVDSGKKLGWKDRPETSGSKARKCSIYIRRVRNNLFHGGKFDDAWIPPDRNEKTITHALKVMDAFLSLNANVGDYFEHAILR